MDQGLTTLKKSWRPITLLIFDYKQMAKVLDELFKFVIDAVIHKEKLCVVLGKQSHRSLL